MSLDYLGNHEPRKLSFQSCKRLENDTAFAFCIFDINQPILVTLVDNKIALLSSLQCANIISRLAIFVGGAVVQR